MSTVYVRAILIGLAGAATALGAVFPKYQTMLTAIGIFLGGWATPAPGAAPGKLPPDPPTPS